MSPDKTAIEKLWEKHSDTRSPFHNPVDVMYKEDFLAALSEAEGERWISVEERLPEEGDHVPVIVCIAGVTQNQTAYLLDGWLYWGDRDSDPCPIDRMTHWRPLPAPPKEKP